MMKIVQELQRKRKGVRLLWEYREEDNDSLLTRDPFAYRYLAVVKIFFENEGWGSYCFSDDPLSTEEVHSKWLVLVKKIINTVPAELQNKFHAAYPKIENIIPYNFTK